MQLNVIFLLACCVCRLCDTNDRWWWTVASLSLTVIPFIWNVNSQNKLEWWSHSAWRATYTYFVGPDTLYSFIVVYSLSFEKTDTGNLEIYNNYGGLSCWGVGGLILICKTSQLPLSCQKKKSAQLQSFLFSSPWNSVTHVICRMTSWSYKGYKVQLLVHISFLYNFNLFWRQFFGNSNVFKQFHMY